MKGEDNYKKGYGQRRRIGSYWIIYRFEECGKSCRLRWMNYLSPSVKHGEFTEQRKTSSLDSIISLETGGLDCWKGSWANRQPSEEPLELSFVQEARHQEEE
ncbi:hypothetical protein CK203_016856 [Vitis vinifera]|uniref:HTH myb-type domain-containing protein n=1 Tax=Vitis vinifera TaxID=29760 RepID=A0A438JNB6_VITVI|nr:hypothetical protein CK203_016856 [Vitis vinifera]